MPAGASRELLIQASYLVTALLFIIGLKRMSSPVTRAQRHPVGRRRHGWWRRWSRSCTRA